VLHLTARPLLPLLVTAVLPVLSGACAQTPGDSVIDTTFDVCQPLVLAAPGATEEELASIDDAIALWAERGIVELTREPIPGAPTVPIHFEPAAGAFHGVYEDEQGVIYINSTLEDPGDRAITIAHELGHALGLPHIDVAERISVMNPGNLDVEPTDADADALAAIWGPCDEPRRSLD
jgi:hypothetical protein